MIVSLRFEGEDAIAKALKNMSKKAEIEVRKAVDGTGLELRGDIAKRYNQGPTSGVVYEKYNPRRTHQASGAGQAPQTDTGRLASSITFKRDLKRISATVGSELVYAWYLEFGTMNIDARPAWGPAVEAMMSKFNKRIEKAIRKSMP